MPLERRLFLVRRVPSALFYWGAAMSRSRVRAKHRQHRGIKVAGAAAVAVAVLTGATVQLAGQGEVLKAEALIPARSEIREAAETAASSARSVAQQVRDARSTAREARSAAREARAAIRDGRSAARDTRSTTEGTAPAPSSDQVDSDAQAPAADAPEAPQAPVAVDAAPAAPATATAAGVDRLTSAAIFKAGPYREPGNVPALKAAELEKQGRTADAALIRQISSQPIAMWFGDWLTGDALAAHLTRHTTRAAAEGTTPVFVTYAIPGRDCAGYSAGGLSPDAYLAWNRTVAQNLAGTGAVVIVEPDAVALMGNPECAPYEEQRLSLLRQSVEILAGAGLVVYLDAGNSNWVPAETMAARLKAAGIGSARGFSSNVSSFNSTANELAYAERLSGLLGGKHFVVDTSRNGARVSGWCNPVGAALGQNPSVSTAGGALDALLWVKPAGESDGTCNGGPAAGQWFEQYALDLVRNRR